MHASTFRIQLAPNCLRAEPDEVGVLQQAAEGEAVHRGLLEVLAEDEVRRQEVHQHDQRPVEGGSARTRVNSVAMGPSAHASSMAA